MRSSVTPARRRLSLAVSLVVKNQLVMESVTTRLISSGMVQSPDRMPPSTWATGIPNLRATMEQAMVEVTSPTTRHSSLFSFNKTFS